MLDKNISEIEFHQALLVQQANNGFAVNEIYKTINDLKDQNKRINDQLMIVVYPKEDTTSNQLELGIALAGGNCVAIRPDEKLKDEKNLVGLNYSVKPGKRIVAGDSSEYLDKSM